MRSATERERDELTTVGRLGTVPVEESSSYTVAAQDFSAFALRDTHDQVSRAVSKDSGCGIILRYRQVMYSSGTRQ